jgi:hypothetical protein
MVSGIKISLRIPSLLSFTKLLLFSAIISFNIYLEAAIHIQIPSFKVTLSCSH